MMNKIENSLVDQIISKSSLYGQFDEYAFMLEHNTLDTDQRKAIRFSADLARILFCVEGLDEIQSDYYFWDKTTVSFKQPLLQIIQSEMKVLEIGCGPVAMLSLFLAKTQKNISVTSADINVSFLATALRAAQINNLTLNLVESNMAQNLKEKFDLIFMNPPYVTSQGLKNIGVEATSSEGRSGHGGEDGCGVINQFLGEVPRILNEQGKALLGINTFFLADDVICRCIENSSFHLVQKLYPSKDTHPNGPYSQIYVLETI